jgi:hypothetical protein
VDKRVRPRRPLHIPLLCSLFLILCIVVIAPVGGVACTTHQCDGDFQDFFGGRVVDANTYETNAIDEPWLDYPGQRSYLIHFPIDFGRPPLWTDTYVATDPNANAPGNQWAQTAGNLAEMGVASSTAIFVHNDTCADYYLRVVVHFPPVEATDAGAGATDGSTE